MNSRFILLATIATFVVAIEVHADAGPNKVLLIGIDGLRPDALKAADAPNLHALMEAGAYSLEAKTDQHTISGAGWSSMLTGVWPSRHNVPNNEFRRPKYDDYPMFFTRLKQSNPAIRTAAFTSWDPLDKYLITDANTDHRFFLDYESDGDAELTRMAATFLTGADVDAVFFYYADVDVAGHAHGFHPDSAPYLAEIAEVDEQMGRLLGALEARPNYDDENWLILICTDHGGTLDGAHGRDEPKHRTIPFIAGGAGSAVGVIYPTPNVVDIAVTAMTHLGVEIEPEWQLDGMPRGLAADPPQFNANLIVNGDAEYNVGAEVSKVDLGVPGWIDTGSMTVMQYGGEGGYPTLNDAGPENRGRNFFSGAAEEDCSITQTIDVAPLASTIDRGGAQATLSGWLGGYLDQRDFATVTMFYMDERGHTLGSARIGPVTSRDRAAELGTDVESRARTGLVYRETKSDVPVGTRRIKVTLESERGDGLTDGYADNLSLVLATPG